MNYVKSIIIGILILALVSVNSIATGQLKPTAYGDINGDASIDKLDVMSLIDAVQNGYSLTNEQKISCDFNDDFRVDSRDVIILMDYYFDGIRTQGTNVGQPLTFT